MDFADRINSDPNVCHGKPCFKGTRVMVSIVLDCLAADMTTEEILDEYPSLEAEDVTAALEYAAALVRDEPCPAEGSSAGGDRQTTAARTGRADRIREFVYEHYIAPARDRGDHQVTVRAGDVARDMRLQDRMPAVCSALGTRKFEEAYDVQRTELTGPANGANARFTFEIRS